MFSSQVSLWLLLQCGAQQGRGWKLQGVINYCSGFSATVTSFDYVSYVDLAITFSEVWKNSRVELAQFP